MGGSVTFLKWVQLLLKLASIEFFASTALPGWYAITSRASISFLFYLLSFVTGTALAYLCLPVEPLWTSDGLNDYKLAFEKMFRLNLFSDFDSGMLGITPKVNFT